MNISVFIDSPLEKRLKTLQTSSESFTSKVLEELETSKIVIFRGLQVLIVLVPFWAQFFSVLSLNIIKMIRE
jgi:predicted nucleotide-binding protein (sugar kinase/HSP70/actin superfamily)